MKYISLNSDSRSKIFFAFSYRKYFQLPHLLVELFRFSSLRVALNNLYVQFYCFIPKSGVVLVDYFDVSHFFFFFNKMQNLLMFVSFFFHYTRFIPSSARTVLTFYTCCIWYMTLTCSLLSL